MATRASEPVDGAAGHDGLIGGAHGGDDLDVDEFAGLVGGQLGQRHAVGDAGVVDEHGQRLGGADLGDGVDADVGGQVGGDGADLLRQLAFNTQYVSPGVAGARPSSGSSPLLQ